MALILGVSVLSDRQQWWVGLRSCRSTLAKWPDAGFRRVMMAGCEVCFVFHEASLSTIGIRRAFAMSAVR